MIFSILQTLAFLKMQLFSAEIQSGKGMKKGLHLFGRKAKGNYSFIN